MVDQHFKFAMPDLSVIKSPVMPDTAMRIIIGKWKLHNDQVWFYAHNFIRTVDDAVIEYEAARSSYLGQLDALRNGLLPISLVFRSIAHMEHCICSIRRALRFLDRLRRHKDSPSISRTARNIIDSYGDAYVNLRDIIEHMDERIADGTIVKGKKPMLMLSDNGKGMEIADLSLQFDEMAALLGHLKQLAVELSQE